MIPFNKPFISGDEMALIEDAVVQGHISGNGQYTKTCQAFMESRYAFEKCLLTTSCTDALEMSALLTNIEPNDEVIVPSFTFTSTANAFVLRGAKIVFADSEPNHPNIDANHLEELITERTKAVVVVHYAGVACDMDKIMALADKHNFFVIEDAAQAIDSYYRDKPLGGIGHFGTFSFHETKNVSCGEGGMLAINSKKYVDRAEIVWEKGTNRAAFFRGKVDKYNWVDVGSSYLPSELNAAYLYAQLQNIESIQNERKRIWNSYHERNRQLKNDGFFSVPELPGFATNNYHMYYIVCNSSSDRDGLLDHLKERGILAVFHYLPLHQSPYFASSYEGRELINAVKFSERIARLPFYYGLAEEVIEKICEEVDSYFRS